MYGGSLLSSHAIQPNEHQQLHCFSKRDNSSLPLLDKEGMTFETLRRRVDCSPLSTLSPPLRGAEPQTFKVYPGDWKTLLMQQFG